VVGYRYCWWYENNKDNQPQHRAPLLCQTSNNKDNQPQHRAPLLC
jgi:hypothetical protein